MAAKCKCPDGVPEWVVTYGDMMSLLLCFFILLAAFSEMKKDDEYLEAVRAIQEAFGYTGGAGAIPTEEMPQNSLLSVLEEVALHKEKIRTRSNTDDPGIQGRDTTVKKIREGLQFTVGGLLTFEPGSAELKPQAIEELGRIANVMRGHNNKIEIRGHASGADLVSDPQYASMWELSFARAQAAMSVLTNDQNKIDPRRIRLVGCGDKEPLTSRVYDPKQLSINRRVEVLVNESLVQDFQAPADMTHVPATR